jgi:integrase
MTLRDAESQIEVPAGVPGAREPQTNEPRAKRRAARRTRSPHPGVVMIRPDDEHAYWRARYADPDTGRTVKVRLDPLALGTSEARREWAITKSRALARRRMELESGAPKATGTGLTDAVKRYYEANPQLRPKTLAAYKATTKKLLAWAARNGVDSADDLTRAKLLGFREELVSQPKLSAAAKGKRGARRETRQRRSAHSINRELRAARTVLGYLAELELLPRIREGDLRRALKKVAASLEQPTFLRPAEIGALLEAALAHDAATFAETRAEHRGEGELGTTTRHDPVAPFLATLLLSGMRLREVVDLTWAQVDLDAAGHDGKPVGEIHLSGDDTKTKRARVVDLAVAPLLRDLLSELRKKSRKKGRVFPLTYDGAAAAAKRLKAKHEAPAGFSWQVLRSTCGTYLTNAPGIFGAASAYRSARQLGHSVTVAEKHYVGLIRLSPAAASLEEAMGVTSLLQRVIDASRG